MSRLSIALQHKTIHKEPGTIVTTLQRLARWPRLPPHQSNSAYAWLTTLVFFFWKYFSQSNNPVEIALAVLTTVVFLVLYWSSFWVTGKAGFAIVAAIAALGLAWAHTNPGASVFIVFAAATCSVVQPLRVAYVCLALILASVGVEIVLLDLHAEFWMPAFLVSSAIGAATIMQSNLRRSERKLLRSQEEVAHLATIAERERISRDLHDLLGHTLSMITIKAELAGKLIQRDAAACQKEIADIEQTARNALAEVRSAVSGYRQVGLTHELANAAGSLAAANILLTTRIDDARLSATTENVLSLALREAITNVLRHSGATQCKIELTAHNGMASLQVADNGQRLVDQHAVQAGNGLTGMRERVEAAGGNIAVTIGNGLCVQVNLPQTENGDKQ
jgi:two-component system sensor histidine kinase DesK